VQDLSYTSRIGQPVLHNTHRRVHLHSPSVLDMLLLVLDLLLQVLDLLLQVLDMLLQVLDLHLQVRIQTNLIVHQFPRSLR